MKGFWSRAFDLVQTYGWVVPAFVLGTGTGAALLSGSRWFEIISALGTLGAAIAAFWSVNFTRREQKKREQQEDEARRPYLHITAVYAIPKTPKFAVHFINLSQQAIFVAELVQPDARGFNRPLDPPGIGVAAPAGGVAKCQVDLSSLRHEGPCDLLFYFNYAMTGPQFHRLRLPIEVEMKHGSTYIEFHLGNQQIEEFTKPPFTAHSAKLRTYGS